MNILVDQNGRARVSDFSFATVNHSWCSTCVAKIYPDTRWTAPEVLKGKQPLTKEADVFSFAMIVVEVSRSVCRTATRLTNPRFNEGPRWRSSIRGLSPHDTASKNNRRGAPSTAG